MDRHPKSEGQNPIPTPIWPGSAKLRNWSLLILAQIFATAFSSAAADRIPWTTGRVSGSPLPPAPYRVERRFTAVEFDHPVDLCVAPGSDRIFVAEQSGRISSFVPGAAPRPAELIDLRRHHRPLDGVLGFTFHPGFATNRYIFINGNEPGGRTNGSFVARFTVSTNDPPTVDPTSKKVIIRWFSGGHNGCTLAFGPDGLLYISTGDSADPDPPDGRFKTGQDNRDLLASILRIDVDRTDGTNAYSIPADNPFRHQADSRPEIWAFGFRNPFRMAFDRVTGELWAGDVGWEQWEMIYRVERGGNYGWPIVEGPNQNVRRDVVPGPGPILPPMVALPHSDAASITGGTVYHGRKLPGLRGAYVYGDWETGKFWALRQKAGRLESNEELCDTALKPTAFALTADGELLILDYNGAIYGLAENVGTAANQSFPQRLSDTGLFTTTTGPDSTLLRPLQPAHGTHPYRIGVPMWNDHATAQWLLAVPGTATIATSGGVGNITGGTWYFPTNTVLARTLSLEFEAGLPASARPIETQLLHWDGQAWNPYTYRWRTNGLDADLVGTAGTNEMFVVRDGNAPGGERLTPWRYMTRAECLRCHNAWAGEALTLNWAQLGSPHAAESQLQGLVDAGLLRLTSAPASAETLTHPADDTASISDRARSWLHVNCSACHRFGAGGAVAIHLNFEKKLNELRALEAKPLRGEFGLAHARIIAPGDPYRSVLFQRISTESAGRMPHIGSRLVDAEGVRVVRQWIESLDVAPTNTTEENAARQLLADLKRERAALAGPDREKAIAALLASPNGSLALLDALKDYPAARTAAAKQAAGHTNLLVRDLFSQLLPPAERRATLGADPVPDSILSLRGDATRGGTLFAGMAQCGNCHLHAGGGRAFGPDLAGVGRKYDRSRLLDQILYPSRIIAPEHKLFTITTRDDRELNGFIVRRSADELVLKDQNLVEHRLKLTEIAQQQESHLSGMPEGLLAPLTAQEAADLLEYLARRQ